MARSNVHAYLRGLFATGGAACRPRRINKFLMANGNQLPLVVKTVKFIDRLLN